MKAHKKFNLTAFVARRGLVLFLLAGVLSACSVRHSVREVALALPPLHLDHIETHEFVLPKDDDLIGELATVPTKEGDSLSDLARHFGLGFEQITAANPDVEPWAPPGNASVALPLRFVLPSATRKGIVVNLATMRLFYFPTGGQEDQRVLTYPVGVGKEGRSTPTGMMAIERKKEHPTWYVPESIRRDHALKGDPLPAAVSPGPDNPLGDYALYLTKPSYLIHGTNKPYSIGFRASNGCVRLYPEDIEKLFHAVARKTPVKIVNQPFLIGKSAGMLYLEAHAPHDELDVKRLKKEVVAKLKQGEKKQRWLIDWPKVEETLAQARGVPVPILATSAAMPERSEKVVRLVRPGKLYGQSEPPPLLLDGWYVRAAETPDEARARRLAAMLNHQGPRIPAQTVLANGVYQVLAGPYADAKASKRAAKRLKIDLEIKGEIVEPAELLSMDSEAH